MENRTEFVGMGAGSRGKQEIVNRSELMLQALFGTFSYIVAAGTMLEGLSPFGAALTAACPDKLLLFCTIGAVGGCLFPTGVMLSMKYAAAVLIAAVIRWALFNGKLLNWSAMWAPAVAGVSLFLPSAAVALTEGGGVYGIALSVAEALLSAGAAYFFGKTVELLRQGMVSLKHSDGICAMVSLCILILSLSGFHLFDLSLGRIAAGVVMILCAAVSGEAVGAAVGAACGAAISMAQFPDLAPIGTYALCGLISGVFSHIGKLPCAAAYLFSGILLALLQYEAAAALPMILESTIVVTLFLLIPLGWLRNFSIRTFRQLDKVEGRGMKELLLARVEDASLALKEIAAATKELSARLDGAKSGSIEEVYQTAVDKVCRNCGRNHRCWQEEYGDSMNCFHHFTEILRKNGGISNGDFTAPLSFHCLNREKLCDVINSRYEAFLDRAGFRRKAARVRGVVSDQFEGMAELLRGFGEEMLQLNSCDKRLNQKLQTYLETLPVDLQAVSCYRDKENVLFLQILIPERKLPRIDPRELADELSELCGCDLEDPQIVCFNGKARLTLREMADYYMDFAHSQHICGGAGVCGDSCSNFTDRRSVAHMLISDGMGSGSGAAVDSAITVDLLSRLIDANVAYDPALKIINSALLVKTGEESLATIDITAVDLYSGRADFYKAGAAPTFVRRHQRTGYVESISLPVGILNAVEFEKSSMQLSAGDMIVMVSDGATTSGLDWIRHTIDRFDSDDLQSLCDDIAVTARAKRSDNRDDDITVLAGILRKR